MNIVFCDLEDFVVGKPSFLPAKHLLLWRGQEPKYSSAIKAVNDNSKKE